MHIELKYHDTTKKKDINLSIMIQIKKKEDIHRFYSRSSFNTPTFYFLYILVILLLNSTTPVNTN